MGNGQDRVARKIDLVERVHPKKAGAVNGKADGVVFFEDYDVVPFGGERAGGDETGGAGTDDDYITHNPAFNIFSRALPMFHAS
jgi:hypothetical protein